MLSTSTSRLAFACRVASAVGTLAILAVGHVVDAADPGRETMVAFTTEDYRDLDGGATLARVETLRGRIYLIGGLRPLGDTIALAPGAAASRVALSPRGDLVAYRGTSGGSYLENLTGVMVVDTTGAIRATFPMAWSFAWNSDGSSLAVAYSRADSGSAIREGIRIWDPARSDTRTMAPFANDIAWGNGDTLLLAEPWGISALAPGADRPRASGHRSIDFSPDGRFSIVRSPSAPGAALRFQIWEEARGVERLACCWRSIGTALGLKLSSGPDRHEDRRGKSGARTCYASITPPSWPRQEPIDGVLGDLRRPFWIRTPGAAHLLTIEADRAGPNARTVVLDVDREEVLAVLDGRALRMTSDQRGILLIRPDDNLTIVPARPLVELAAARAAAATPKGPTCSVRVETRQVETWRGHSDRRAMGKGTYTVGAGEWIPAFLPGAGPCDRFFQVVEIRRNGTARLRFDPRRLTRLEINGRVVALAGAERQDFDLVWSDITLAVELSDPSIWYRQAGQAPPTLRFEVRLSRAP